MATSSGALTSSTLTTCDGTTLDYKVWRRGPPVVFSHGYLLSSDAWDSQMLFLSQRGYRVVAHDRRGFGRSSQPGGGYDYATFADDLAALVAALGLENATFVGHSMGGGEAARYVARHGRERVAKLALIGSVTPFLLRTDTNLDGAPPEIFDGMRAAVQAGRSQFFRDVTMPYYNYNRPGAEISEGVRDQFWRQGMNTGMLASYHAIGAFAGTGFREDLRQIEVPTLILHGSDDQIVPIEISGIPASRILMKSRLVTYDGASHGLIVTHQDRVNADLLEFLQS